MKTVAQIKAAILALCDRVQAISAIAKEEKREYTDEEASEIDSINGAGEVKGKIDALTIDLERAQKQEAVEMRMAAIRGGKNIDAKERDASDNLNPDDDPIARIKVPAKAARRSFDTRCFASVTEAYATGQWCLATLGKNVKAQQWCVDNGVMAAMSEGVNSAGGFLVPDFFETSIIRIVEAYGVFRKNSYVYPMGSDTVKVPRRANGFTVYYVGENTVIPTSDMSFTQVQLVARKPAILTQISSELNEDEVVGLAGLLTKEFGYALAVAEDAAGFNGDGTSTYGGIVGLKNALLAGSIVDAAAGHTSFGTITLSDFHKAKGVMPGFTGAQNKWYMSRQAFAQTMEPLAMATGGATSTTLADGMMPMFLGDPVVFTPSLSTTSAVQTSTIIAYYGDLAMATTMGTRRKMTIKSDESFYFNQDAIAVRCTERYDINVHEVGAASAPGPIVALKTAAS